MKDTTASATLQLEYWDRIAPRKLYKYRSINEFLFKMLETNTLWYSNPFEFNDPFDCRLSVKMGKDKKAIEENLGQYSKLVSLKIRDRDVMQEMLEDVRFYNTLMSDIFQHINYTRVGVSCFAEECNNLLMWAHYASSHKGVCLEFNIDRKGFLFKNMLPVLYRKTYPRFDLSDFRNYDRAMYAMYNRSICTKSSHWSYEKEWRVISEDGSGLNEFDKKDLTKIIFGVLASDDDIQKVVSHAERNYYPSVRFYKCEMKKRTYGLKIQKL